MRALQLGLVSAILVATFTVPWVIHHRAELEVRANEESLTEQASRLIESSAETKRLSHTVAQMEHSRSLSDAQLVDLLRLRNEIGQLRGTAMEMDQVQRRISRLRDRLQDAAMEAERGRDSDTALLVDEMPLRQWRLVRLKRWLENMPQEKTPELQFLPESAWIAVADRPLVTEDDYRSRMSNLRDYGETEFASMALKALKQYAKANHGQFPTEVSQLQTYFESAIDAAILQRYEVVPAKSLAESLADTGGDWLITQKAPVNKVWDLRVAIGLTHWKGTLGAGRWDPVP
ncbi:MAG: hypothetical protein JWR69_272 [Pedosphaera sp.]|nr:hypothetical protein [Pedosphaera sp.]